VSTAAQMLDVSQSLVWKMISDGRLESRKVAKLRVVLLRSIDALLGIDGG
jgi:hypothetical protein